RQELGRRVASAKSRVFVEVAIIEPGENGVERMRGAADVHDDAAGVERGSAKLGVDDVRGAVQLLCGTEHLSAKAVRDHHVTADRHAVHRRRSSSVADGW